VHDAVDGVASSENNAYNNNRALCVRNEFSVVYAEHADFWFYDSKVLGATQVFPFSQGKYRRSLNLKAVILSRKQQFMFKQNKKEDKKFLD
jgi:hypothetical protein